MKSETLKKQLQEAKKRLVFPEEFTAPPEPSYELDSPKMAKTKIISKYKKTMKLTEKNYID